MHIPPIQSGSLLRIRGVRVLSVLSGGNTDIIRTLVMAADAGDTVCPSSDQLAVHGVVQCPLEGCKEQLYGLSRLQMHILRHHLGRALQDGRGRKAVSFFCPHRGCERGFGKGKPFPRMGQLKQVMDRV